MNPARTAVPALALAAAASLAACSSGPPAASQISPGSKVTPCAQLDGRIRALLSAYAGGDSGRLWAAQQALAGAIGGNVSNLDPPQALSRAEVDFQSDAQYGGYVTRNDPYSPVVQDDAVALAAACGIATAGGQ